MGRILVFLDETYPAKGDAEILAVAAVGVFRSHWHRYAGQLPILAGVRAARKLETIRGFVADRRMLAVIAGTRLDFVNARARHRDTFTDVGPVSRRNSVWAQTMGKATAIILRRVVEMGWRVQTCDILYDPKSLTQRHREQVHRSLRRILQKFASRLACSDVTIGTIREIKKDVGESELGWGTWLAHWVAKLPHKYAGPTMPSNVEVYDVTKGTF
jgi:hypothetical protein